MAVSSGQTGSSAASSSSLTSTTLPEPRSSHLSEIQFRRLLRSCQQLLTQHQQAQQQGSDASGAPVSAQKFKAFVHALQDQLADLERSSIRELDTRTLDLYHQAVKVLAAAVPPPQPPPYCVKPPAPGAQPPMMLGAVASRSSSMAARGEAGGTVEAPWASTAGLGADTRDKLAQHEALQSSLTEEMVSMAASLKASSLTMQEAVRKRGEVVDGAEAALAASLEGAKEVAKKSKEQYGRGRGTFCLTLLILLLVGGVFSFMVVYIKFTHLLGFRAPRGVGEL